MRQPLTREAIAEAARDILVSEGLQGVSLRKVAGRLGVTAPALYAHVADKRDLLQGIADQEIDNLLERFRSARGTDPVDRVSQQCHAYLDWATDNPDLFRALFLYQPELTNERTGEESPPVVRLFEEISRAVHDARNGGHLGNGDDPQDASLALWASIHGAAVTLLAGPPIEPHRRSKLCRTVVEAMVAGLRDSERAVA